jgi:CRP-like cAMP-binding protein
VQIAWRATRIETFRREVVTLPNNVIAKHAVMNFSRGYRPIGIDLPLGISYRAPPNLVRQVVLEALREIPLILKEPPPLCRTWAYDESTVRYMIRYFVADFAQADNVRDEIYSRLWYALSRAGIEVPLPQRVLTLREPDDVQQQANSRVSLLRSIDLFHTLSARELAMLGAGAQTRRFAKGERVISEGEEGKTFYIVASGEVSVRKPNGESDVARLKTGQYFGEMSLLTGEPRVATVVAETDVELLEINRTAFAQVFEAQPTLARHLSALLAQRRNQLKATPTVAAPAGVEVAAPEPERILSKLAHNFKLGAE